MNNLKLLAAIATLTFALPLHAVAAGAIAVDDEDGATPGYGWVIGQKSTENAGNAAMAECFDGGGKQCRVAVRFEACGAYAASWRFSHAGSGATKAEAIKAALKDCKDCKVVVADCDNSPQSKTNLRMTSVGR
jgi:hypothetical protein